MSVSIGYRPKKNNWKDIDGGSQLLDIIQENIGMTLTEKDIPFLRGVAASGHKGAEELIDATESQQRGLSDGKI